MKLLNRNRLATAILLASGSATAFAQTSSSIRGVVTGPDGQAAQANVMIIHTPSGSVSEVSTNENGRFTAKGLRIGGPYRIIVDSDVYADDIEENVYLQVGQTYKHVSQLTNDGANIEEVVVTGQRINSYESNGPSAVFDLTTLQSAPAINRDIADILRRDPRIFVSPRGEVQCGGKNPRYNSLTLNGIRMNDAFGLNQSGYPTERMPFSYDAIEQVSAELAPFDAQFGGFTACNINAVTKSGSNEFSGSMFYDFVDESLKGDSLEGDKLNTADFSESRLGFTLGGPIVKDKLFFFASYEHLDGTNLFDRGALGTGAVQEVDITQAEVEEIARIARDVYQYDPGSIPSSAGNEDEKLLVKLDWNISDDHRLAFTYNYNDGFNISGADRDSNELEFSNHYYERGAELNGLNTTLFSNWTEDFSTEITIDRIELDNRQLSLAGTDFGEIRVRTDDVNVFLGGDDSRQANKLKYDITTLRFKGSYDLVDHALSFGVERQDLNIFNLFVQHTETEIRFSSIEDFEKGLADRIYYNNAPSHNPEDAAAEWGYAQNTLFAQDDWQATDNAVVTFGLRYDWYTTSDRPEENAQFVSDYGFSNSQTLDGEGLLQPRIALNMDVSDQLSVRAGAGLYTGGNPNVWLSNTFSSTNTSQFGAREDDFDLFTDTYSDVESGAPAGAGPGWGIPNTLRDKVSTGTGDNNDINFLDPDFTLPSEMKFALGATFSTESDLRIDADVLYSISRDPAVIRHAGIRDTGQISDRGYPVLETIKRIGADGQVETDQDGKPVKIVQSLMLTNSDENPQALMVSLALSQSYDFGLDWQLGYAFSDAEDVQPMNSAVAFSNYQQRAFYNPQADEVSTSDWNVTHRFTGSLSYTQNWFANYATQFSFFATANEGRAFSYVLNGRENRVFNGTPYLEGDNVLAPGEMRNEHRGSWSGKLDLRVSQELPGFNTAHKASAFLLIDNLTNLLNDEWGAVYEPNFPGGVVRSQQPDEVRLGDASLYEVRLGLQYNF